MSEGVFVAIIGAVAAIFASVVTYLIAVRNSRQQYITSERANWRKKMRELTERLMNFSAVNPFAALSDTEKENFHKLLNSLKVNLNPYGIFETDSEIPCRNKRDAHIWEKIQEIENILNKESMSSDDYVRFIDEKNLMCNYLLLLLKHDWERSKGEVIGAKNVIHYILLILLAVISPLFLWIKGVSEINILFSVELILLIVPFLISQTGNEVDEKKQKNSKEKKGNVKGAKKGKLSDIIIYIICAFMLTSVMYVVFFYETSICKSGKSDASSSSVIETDEMMLNLKIRDDKIVLTNVFSNDSEIFTTTENKNDKLKVSLSEIFLFLIVICIGALSFTWKNALRTNDSEYLEKIQKLNDYTMQSKGDA